MVGEVEGLEEPSVQWRRGGRVGRELKRLRQRAQSILDDWLDCYRVAIGITRPFWGLKLLNVCTNCGVRGSDITLRTLSLQKVTHCLILQTHHY